MEEENLRSSKRPRKEVNYYPKVKLPKMERDVAVVQRTVIYNAFELCKIDEQTTVAKTNESEKIAIESDETDGSDSPSTSHQNIPSTSRPNIFHEQSALGVQNANVENAANDTDRVSLEETDRSNLPDAQPSSHPNLGVIIDHEEWVSNVQDKNVSSSSEASQGADLESVAELKIAADRAAKNRKIWANYSATKERIKTDEEANLKKAAVELRIIKTDEEANLKKAAVELRIIEIQQMAKNETTEAYRDAEIKEIDVDLEADHKRIDAKATAKH